MPCQSRLWESRKLEISISGSTGGRTHPRLYSTGHLFFFRKKKKIIEVFCIWSYYIYYEQHEYKYEGEIEHEGFKGGMIASKIY
jgi:hypothetical protein